MLSNAFFQSAKLPRIADLAFPDDEHAPSTRNQFPVFLPIPQSVLAKFLSPPFCICGRGGRVFAASMPVPKASVHEECGTVAWKYEIRLARQISAMQAKP